MQAKKLKNKGKKPSQITLDGVVSKVSMAVSFSKQAILETVTQHVVCRNEVSSTRDIYIPAHLSFTQAILLVGKASFNNCLVTMRSKTTHEELPTP